MADTYKILGQAVTNTTETTVYTVPSGKNAVISDMLITNLENASRLYTVTIWPSADLGGPQKDEQKLLWVTVPAYGTYKIKGIVLDQGDQIKVFQSASSTGTPTTVSVFGVEKAIQSGIRYKILAQTPYSYTTPRLLYTVPAGKETVLTSIFSAFRTTGTEFYDIAIVPSGETLSAKHYLFFNSAIGSNIIGDTKIRDSKITMGTGDRIYVDSTFEGPVGYTVFGVEIG